MEEKNKLKSWGPMGKKAPLNRSPKIRPLCAVFCAAVLPLGLVVLPLAGVLAVPSVSVTGATAVQPPPDGNGTAGTQERYYR